MTDAPQSGRRSSVWLIASLCANFFLIGLIVAGLLVARGRMIANAVRGPEGGLSPEVVLQLLPPSGAVKMCDALAVNTDAFRKLGRDLVDARRDLFRAFSAEPFDPTAFKSALDRATTAQIALVQLRQNIAFQVTEKLDATERQELSRKLFQRFFTGARRNHGDHPTLRALCAATGARGADQLPR
jgi:uncharacterized membrane protein